MKLLLLTIFLISGASTYSQQWHLNETEGEIREQATTEIRVGTTKSGKTLNWVDHDLGCSITAMFGVNGYTWGSIYYPLNVNSFNALLEFIHKKAITITDTKWKFYTGGKVIEAELIYEPDRELKYRITFLLK